MTRRLTPGRLGALLLAAVLLLAGCTERMPLAAPDGAVFSKSNGKGGGGGGSGGDPVVSSVDPAYGNQGDPGMKVRVYGSGFDQSSTATWQRNGVPDPKVITHSTRFISSSELEAEITIASDAELDFYDVEVVLSSGKRGIGLEVFEVTQAIALETFGGHSLVRGVNDRGEAAGYSMKGNTQHAVFWRGTAATDLGPGQAWGIDEAGTTIIGNAGTWTVSDGVPGGFLPLPKHSSALEVHAFAIGSDSDGVAVIIGGGQATSRRKGNALHRPVLWWKQNGGWSSPQQLSMPLSHPDASAWINDVNGAGEAVGQVQIGSGELQAVFWDGAGNAFLIGPVGSRADGIDSAGMIAVGDSPDGAVYWTREVGGAWAGPIALPGGCGRAMGVDDHRRIVGRCSSGTGLRKHSAVWLPGNGGYEKLQLRGLGDATDGGMAEAISREGTVIGGAAKNRNVSNVSFPVVWEALQRPAEVLGS